ncbi:MAG TPA: hypothetical protein VN371_05000 [Chlorobaculum sp.]|nr:hypothetical protein [Chlorobaculum sp.]
MKRKLTIASLVTLCTAPMLLPSQDASAMPAFARKYGTSCYTCHSGFPTRNAFGEAFRNNGYRWPGGEDEDKAKQEQLKLGSEGWKKSFPDSPYPADIPGYAPVGFWFRGQLVNYSDEVKNAADVVKTKSTFNNGTGILSTSTLFFGGTIGNNLSAFGQYNLSTTTAPTGHVIWAFAPGVNLALGNGFSDFTFGNQIQVYNSTFQSPGTGAEFSYITGKSGGFKLNVGIAEGGTANTNMFTDIIYAHAKYKIGGAGLLSGAGGTYGNEYVGLDNHIAIGATFMTANKGIMTGNYTGETKIYGFDVTGNYSNLSLGAAYSKDSDLGYNNYRVNAIYFLYPWLQSTVTYSNIRSGAKGVIPAASSPNTNAGTIANRPTLAFGMTAHLRANAYITATYTKELRNRWPANSNPSSPVSSAGDTVPNTFALQGSFAF